MWAWAWWAIRSSMAGNRRASAIRRRAPGGTARNAQKFADSGLARVWHLSRCYTWEVLLGDDVTVEILKEIRDESRATREELRTTREELTDELRTTREELSDRLGRLERRQGESETRLASEVVAVAGAVIDVRDLLRKRLDERERIEDLDRRVQALERKAG